MLRLTADHLLLLQLGEQSFFALENAYDCLSEVLEEESGLLILALDVLSSICNEGFFTNDLEPCYLHVADSANPRCVVGCALATWTNLVLLSVCSRMTSSGELLPVLVTEKTLHCLTAAIAAMQLTHACLSSLSCHVTDQGIVQQKFRFRACDLGLTTC